MKTVNTLNELLFRSFYTELFVFIMAIIAFVVSLLNFRKERTLQLLPFYLLSYILLLSICNYQQLNPNNSLARFWVSFVDLIFTIIETFILCTIFNQIFQIKLHKKVTSIIKWGIIFLILFLIFYDILLFGEIQARTHNLGYTIQSSLLIVPCVFYYIQIFRQPPVNVLTQTPSFWFTTGVFFCMFCCLPFSLIETAVMESNYILYSQLFSINFLLYGLMYSMFIKAYLCNRVKAN